MLYAKIRINKTRDIQQTLSALKKRYTLLNESEIVKMVLSESYWRLKKEKNTTYPDVDPKDLSMQASYAFNIRSDNTEPQNFDRKKLKKVKLADYV